MSGESVPREADFHRLIRERITAGDPDYRLLYKYQAFRDYTCPSLSENLVKYSRYAELNDAFDLAVQYPEPFGPTYGKIAELQKLLTPHEGKGYDFSTRKQHIGLEFEDHQLGPIEALAAIADQLQLEELVENLKSIKLSHRWCGRVLGTAMHIARAMAENSLVYCLTSNPQSHLLWGYYGDGLRGLCIAYGCPVGTNPRILEPVRYSPYVKKFDPIEAVTDPLKTALKMLYTKPTAWKHEAEWRARNCFSDPDDCGITKSMFPILCVIIGFRMPQDDRQKVLDAIDRDKVAVLEACPDRLKGRYRIGWRTLADHALPIDKEMLERFR